MKVRPVLKTCKDVRYKGPMRNICYVYQDPGPHGAILKEKYWDGISGHEDNGPMVSRIDPPVPSPTTQNPSFITNFTEYRGDGPTRTFNYTALQLARPSGPEPETCPTWTQGVDGPAPQQFLTSYTDFKPNTPATIVGYDANWYVNSVRDANLHTTSYLRGSPPPAGIGEIRTITYPGGAHIDYAYYGDGHYLQQITNERGAVTYHFRDGNNRITRTDYKDAYGNLLANETFSYNGFGQVLTHRLKNGAWESFAYDGRGLLTDN
jgi:YD repeat-containing protein